MKKFKLFIIFLFLFIIFCVYFFINVNGGLKQYINEVKIERAFSKKANIEKLKVLSVPLVVIETIDEKEPTCDYLEAPKGSFGSTIINNKYKKASLNIFLRGENIYGGNDKRHLNGAKIRVRGNSSAQKAKKSFRIKLETSADLINGEEEHRDCDWVLLASGANLYTALGFELNKFFALKHVPRYKYVNLVLNGNYRGLYVLAESVKRNDDCRINVADDGFIIENDAYWWNEHPFLKIKNTDPAFGITFKYPKSKKISKEDVEWIQHYMDKTVASLDKDNYDRFIDVDSWVSWILIHDILGTYDMAGANNYMLKYDRTDSTKLEKVYAWDFDSSLMITEGFSNVHKYDSYYNLLFNNPAFIKSYKEKWQNASSLLLKRFDLFCNIFSKKSYVESFNESLILDGNRWQVDNQRLDVQIRAIRKYLYERKVFLDNQIKTMK